MLLGLNTLYIENENVMYQNAIRSAIGLIFNLKLRNQMDEI
jgi:hypothetical protein